jgi:hypothetical protein
MLMGKWIYICLNSEEDGRLGKLNFRHPQLPSEIWVERSPETIRMWKQRENICFCQDSNLGYRERIEVSILTEPSRVSILIWYVYIWSSLGCTNHNYTVSNDCKTENNGFERKQLWRNLRWKSWSSSRGTEENNQNPLPLPRQRLEPDTSLIQFMVLSLRSQHSWSPWYSGIGKRMRNFVKWAIPTCIPVHLKLIIRKLHLPESMELPENDKNQFSKF